MDYTQSTVKDTLSSIYHKWIVRAEDNSPKKLIDFLCSKLPELDRASWPTRLEIGGVCLNGKIIRDDTTLPLPCWIEYFEPRCEPDKIAGLFPQFSKEWILYRDDFLVVAFKPAGLSTTPNRDQQQYCLKNYLEDFLNCTIHLPSRLDTATSGIIVGSCNPASHDPVQKLFERRLVDKTYLLEVSNPVEWDQKEVDLPIGRDPAHPVLRRIDLESGSPARTHFSTVKNNGKFLLAKPYSGRTHQIRVHAEHVAGPIVGDPFYGGEPADTLHLLSLAIGLIHPVTKENLAVRVPAALMPDWCRVGDWGNLNKFLG